MSGGFDLWRAIDAEGGAPANSDFCRGVNAGLEAASKHVEKLGYGEGDIVLPATTVQALITAIYQYENDLLYPPAADSVERRLKMIGELIAATKGDK